MQLMLPMANIYIFLWVAAISALSNKCTQKDICLAPNNLCISTFEGDAWNNLIGNIRPVHVAGHLCAVSHGQLMHECWVSNPPLHTGISAGGLESSPHETLIPSSLTECVRMEHIGKCWSSGVHLTVPTASVEHWLKFQYLKHVCVIHGRVITCFWVVWCLVWHHAEGEVLMKFL